MNPCERTYQSGSISVRIRILKMIALGDTENKYYSDLLCFLGFLHFMEDHPPRPWFPREQNGMWMDVEHLRSSVRVRVRRG